MNDGRALIVLWVVWVLFYGWWLYLDSLAPRIKAERDPSENPAAWFRVRMAFWGAVAASAVWFVWS